MLLQISRGVQKSGALRLALEREGNSQPQQAFSTCMKRLDRDGLVTTGYVKASGKTGGREAIYDLTPAGKKALKDVRQFYRRLERQAGE
jgi:DNA-binding PadR family transcriptional regulator